MRAMILAAGFGTRLRPITDQMPKPLVPVGGLPMICYPLALLRAAGIREVIINLHHLGEQIRETLGDGSRFGLTISYTDENPILDTGGAIKNAEAFLRGDTFVVLNSDMIMDLDLPAVIEFHRTKKSIATMVLRPDPESKRYGEIEIDESCRVRRFLGKPEVASGALTPLMFSGVHVFEPEIFAYMPNGAETAFGITRQTYPAMLAAGCPLFGYRFDGYWRVVDTHDGLAEGRRDVERPGTLASIRDPRRLFLQ